MLGCLARNDHSFALSLFSFLAINNSNSTGNLSIDQGGRARNLLFSAIFCGSAFVDSSFLLLQYLYIDEEDHQGSGVWRQVKILNTVAIFVAILELCIKVFIVLIFYFDKSDTGYKPFIDKESELQRPNNSDRYHVNVRNSILSPRQSPIKEEENFEFDWSDNLDEVLNDPIKKQPQKESRPSNRDSFDPFY